MPLMLLHDDNNNNDNNDNNKYHTKNIEHVIIIFSKIKACLDMPIIIIKLFKNVLGNS